MYPQVLRNLPVTNGEAALQNEAVKASVARATEGLGERGRVLLRKSGTEPVLRVMVEAESEEMCLEWVDHICAAIQAQGFVTGRGR